MVSLEALTSFLHLVADTLSTNAVHPVASQGSQKLTTALKGPVALLGHEPSRIEALGSLETLGAARPSHVLTEAIRAISPELPWVPSHRVDDGGEHVGLVLLEDVVSLGELTAGLTILAANSVYPEHNHPPAEVYLILGGEAQWRYGGSTDCETLGTGDVVHNNPNDWHEIRTGAEPTVAIWFLWDA